MRVRVVPVLSRMLRPSNVTESHWVRIRGTEDKVDIVADAYY